MKFFAELGIIYPEIGGRFEPDTNILAGLRLQGVIIVSYFRRHLKPANQEEKQVLVQLSIRSMLKKQLTIQILRQMMTDYMLFFFHALSLGQNHFHQRRILFV